MHGRLRLLFSYPPATSTSLYLLRRRPPFYRISHSNYSQGRLQHSGRRARENYSEPAARPAMRRQGGIASSPLSTRFTANETRKVTARDLHVEPGSSRHASHPRPRPPKLARCSSARPPEFPLRLPIAEHSDPALVDPALTIHRQCRISTPLPHSSHLGMQCCNSKTIYPPPSGMRTEIQSRGRSLIWAFRLDVILTTQSVGNEAV